MIRCLDLNDDYFGKDGPHPSDTIGAVLAVGDSTQADGKTAVSAVVVAYEVLSSFADAVGLRERGWDYVTFTALAAALGAGKVLNLPEEKLGHCLSLAAVCNSALGQTRLGGAVDVERTGIGQRLSKWRFRRNAWYASALQ